MAMSGLRRAVPPAVRERASAEICRKLLDRTEIREAMAGGRTIAVYLASPQEIDLTEFIRAALAGGASLAAPRWNGAAYELVPLRSTTSLVAGPHGILEPPPPAKPDVAGDCGLLRPAVWLVPGLAFTRAGARLGYGGGWYDRLLAAADCDSVKIGVAYDFQIVDNLPTQPHDQPLTEVVI